MKIDQAGLSAGVAGTARDDGVATGALVTVTSLSHQSTFDVRLLWVGLHGVVDTTSRSTLQKSGPSSYSFSPTPGAIGSWRIELTTDRGTPAEDRQVRIFAIKGGVGKLRIPAANEVADPEANLVNSGAAYVARSEFNAGDGISDSPQEDATYVSHWRPLADLIHQQNVGGGGGEPEGPLPPEFLYQGYSTAGVADTGSTSWTAVSTVLGGAIEDFWELPNGLRSGTSFSLPLAGLYRLHVELTVRTVAAQTVGLRWAQLANMPFGTALSHMTFLAAGDAAPFVLSGVFSSAGDTGDGPEVWDLQIARQTALQSVAFPTLDGELARNFNITIEYIGPVPPAEA